ncbi:MAG: OmpA family protein [Hyphomicrobiaceae bacterium]
MTGIALWAPAVEAADGASKPATTGLELPREVLPWRRQIEARAGRLLATARQSIRDGNRSLAESQLSELVRTYPQTHAAADGQRELALIRQQLPATGVRHGLGAPPTKGAKADHEEVQAPVAGWQTVVSPDPANIREALIEAAGDRVFFDEGSARLSARARSVLKKQARWIRSQPNIKVRVVGHADDVGSSQRNMRLSHDRAVAVRKRLIRYGISPKRLNVFSYGKAQPIAICEVRTCAAQNRRVVTEIRLPDQTASIK